MSHIIPPLVSNSPPPIVNVSDDETFGDFDAPYQYDDLSRPDFGADLMLDVDVVPKSDAGKINGYTPQINGRLDDASIVNDCNGLESDVSNVKISFDSCVVAANGLDGVCSNGSDLDVSVSICVSDSSTNLEIKVTDLDSSVESDEIQNSINGSRLDLAENQRPDSPFGEFVDSSETSLEDRSPEAVGSSKTDQNLDSESTVELESSASGSETDSKEKMACDGFTDSVKTDSNFVEPESGNELVPEFGTFVDSSEAQPKAAATKPDIGEFCQEICDDSDFGDFAEPETDDDAFSDFCSCSRERQRAPEESFDEVVLRMFPKRGGDGEEREADADCRDNAVMDQLRDITDTSALAYQWSKSHSHGAFLKALNIDMRNILYGPRWNESMPRYAATLGFIPLEPVKSEILTPTPADPVPNRPPLRPAGTVPTEFDWSSRESGGGGDRLNDHSVASLPIRAQTDAEGGVASLPVTVRAGAEGAVASLPVTVRAGAEGGVAGVPVIVQSGTEGGVAGFPTSQLPAGAEDGVAKTGDGVARWSGEPEITVAEHSVANSSAVQNHRTWPMPMMVPLRESHISATEFDVDVHTEGTCAAIGRTDEEGFGDFQSCSIPTSKTGNAVRRKTDRSFAHADDDEFTDFHSSLPAPTVQPISNFKSVRPDLEPPQSNFEPFEPNLEPPESDLKPIQSNLEPFRQLEPLMVEPLQPKKPLDRHPPQDKSDLEPIRPKPSFEPLQPRVVSLDGPGKIEWPDPGITEYDIRHIELSYSPINAAQVASTVTQGGEEEDWSEFVSVAPKHLSRCESRRTLTPELPLSVPRLTNVRPPPKPKPLVTSRGLVESTLPPASLVQTSFAVPCVGRDRGQPSLISAEFAARFGQDAEDEWSDFVCGQPPPPASAPNIIANPVPYGSVATGTAARTRRPAGVLGLPGLEFIVPKSRTSKK